MTPEHKELCLAPEAETLRLPTFGVPDYGQTPADMPIPDRLNLGLVVLVFSAALSLLWLGSHVSSWYSVLLVGIVFSYLMLTSYALLHEASHGNLHTSRRVNYLLGVATGLLFPIPFRLMRTTHQNHHHHNRTDHEMFDLYYPTDSRVLKWLQWYGLLGGLFWPLVPLGAVLFALFPGLLRWQMVKKVDPSRGMGIVSNLEPSAIWAMRLELLLIVTFFVLLFWLLDLRWQNTLVLYACFSFNWSTRQYVGHAFSRRDIVEGAWNLRHTPWMSWLLLHGEWDLNHHRRPEVPWYYLPRLSPPDELRRSYWRQYWNQWRGPRPCREAQPQEGARGNPRESRHDPHPDLSLGRPQGKHALCARLADAAAVDGLAGQPDAAQYRGPLPR